MTCDNEIILDSDESLEFIEKMIRPDDEAIARRDKFLTGLDNTKIVFKDDEILVLGMDIALEKGLTMEEKTEVK